MIAELLAAYVTEREEFQLTNGYQPQNSLFFLQKGSFFCNMNEKEETVCAGDAIIFDTVTPIKRQVLEPIRFLYIKYSIQNEALFRIPSGVFRNLSERALDDLSQIEALSHAQTPLRLSLQTHYLNDLLLCLHMQAKESSALICETAIPTELDRPIAYLREHLHEKLSLADLARACGLSVSSLEGKFKALTGQSAYRYLLALRLEHATKLLIDTNYTVTEIASRCGYDNLFYFCNSFKKQTGLTPSEFRARNRI